MWANFKKGISRISQHPRVERPEANWCQLEKVIDTQMIDWSEDAWSEPNFECADMRQQTACCD